MSHEAGLAKVLESAVKRSVGGEDRVAVMFSGGVDSAVLAAVAEKNCDTLVLYTIGTPGSLDLESSISSARSFKAEHKPIELDEETIVRGYNEVMSALKAVGMRATKMDGELGLVVRLCCEAARKDGFESILCGSGAEELFGGYYSHLKHVENGGDLNPLLQKELDGLWEKDLKRNNYVASLSRVKLVLPFLEKEVVDAAMAIPGENKINGGKRKIALRKAAVLLGVEEETAIREKKAAQYGSGIHKVLEKASLA